MYTYTCTVSTFMTVHILYMYKHFYSHRYVNQVKPGRYGVPKPFYFPLQPSYWTGRPCRSTKTRAQVSNPLLVHDSERLHEEEPRDMTIGISIQSLVKIYDNVSSAFSLIMTPSGVVELCCFVYMYILKVCLSCILFACLAVLHRLTVCVVRVAALTLMRRQRGGWQWMDSV